MIAPPASPHTRTSACLVLPHPSPSARLDRAAGPHLVSGHLASAPPCLCDRPAPRAADPRRERRRLFSPAAHSPAPERYLLNQVMLAPIRSLVTARPAPSLVKGSAHLRGKRTGGARLPARVRATKQYSLWVLLAGAHKPCARRATIAQRLCSEYTFDGAPDFVAGKITPQLVSCYRRGLSWARLLSTGGCALWKRWWHYSVFLAPCSWGL